MAGKPPKRGLLGGCDGASQCTDPSPSSASSSSSSSSSSSRSIPVVAAHPGELSGRHIPHGFPTGPTTLVLPTGGASSSSSASQPTAGSGNRAAAGASSALSSFSSPPAAAAVTPILPPELIGVLSEYAEKDKLAFAGFLPREKEGHLELSCERYEEMPLSARRIPPVDGRPSVPIPTNKMTFCTENPDEAILAINSQWNTLNPWRLTVLTVRLSLKEIERDVERTVRILDGIKATLGHVKTLIVTLDQLSLGCASLLSAEPSVLVVPSSVCQNNCDFLQSILRELPKIEAITEAAFCFRVLSMYINTESSPSPLIWMTLDLENDDSWLLYETTMAETGPFDPRLHLMVYFVEKNRRSYKDFWHDPVKRDSLRWLTYFDYIGHSSRNPFSEAIPLIDFSENNRLVEVNIQITDNQVNLIRLPTSVDSLQVLWLRIGYYRGPVIFAGDNRVYPHLRSLHLPQFTNFALDGEEENEHRMAAIVAGAAPCEGIYLTQISSTQFPALKTFGSITLPPRYLLDFSRFVKDGLSFELPYFRGWIIMPDPGVKMGTLTMGLDVIDSCQSFNNILPRFQNFDFSFNDPTKLYIAFSKINPNYRGYAKLAASETIRKLALRKITGRHWRGEEHYGPVVFGRFPELQHLTLENMNVTLDGPNFPKLDAIVATNGNITLRTTFVIDPIINITGGIVRIGAEEEEVEEDSDDDNGSGEEVEEVEDSDDDDFYPAHGNFAVAGPDADGYF